ncbi:putative odorant receptor 71a isoform X3 [Armigeres subalbatus]|uniref:putative odorant receptor 71a isoform X3 n=1 Tax=Armigeres subalbatus TaxID=124917 RepID=UPI002ED59511
MFSSSFFTENLEALWIEILFMLPTEIAMLVKTVSVVNRFEAIYGLNRMTLSKEFKSMCPKQEEEYKRFARETEKQVSWSVFSQICASGVTICAIIFRLSAISLFDNVSSTISMYFYLMSMLTQIFLPCYFGNDVTLKSQKLTNAMYTSDWYQLALRERKDLKMMMIRTSEPIRLKAGNFFNFNLTDFTSTLNRSYSLYAVINRRK